VAVSGGKDSLALWDVLLKMGYKADALYVNLGIGGYSEVSHAKVVKFSETVADPHGAVLHVHTVEQAAGAGIRELAMLIHRPTCSTCGTIKRYQFNRVALELGGKSPFIVLDDADLEAAASAGAWGSYLHQGQVCMASGRHIVLRKVAEEYVSILTRKAGALPVGDPFRQQVAIGPLINAKQLARVDQIVKDTVAAGAKLMTGGTHNGPYYQPTVLHNVRPGMPAYDLEIFGPVAPVIVAEDEEDAIRIANDTEYGLSGAVQTASLERGLRIARRIRAGLVHINDQTIADYAEIPFGGMGMSGNGSRFGSMTNWEEFTEWQWMTIGGKPARYPF
jgi:benzaldehyde dehydrogenase (NAD)